MAADFKPQNGVHIQPMYHQQIIIENPRVDSINLSYCDIHQKNKPQSNSVAGGVFLLLVSGLHIGWGIWGDFLNPLAITLGHPNHPATIMSWYVFAVVGSIVGAVLVIKMKKKFIYYFGGCLLVVSSILFVAVKHQTAIIVGRCLAGFAHGIIYNATITHAAENAVKQIRGMVLSSINCTILSGIFMSTVLRAITTPYIFESDNMDNNMIVGICGLILSILGIVSTTFLTYESIPYLLRRGNEPEAVVNLMMLRNESYMTPNLVEDLNEMRTMVLQDKEENMNVLANGNASAMGKMMVLRVLATLTSNYLINSLLIIMIMLLLQSQSYYMAPVILSGSRFAASFIPVFSTDLFKRKIHLTVSSVTSGTLMLALAIIFASVDIFLSTTYWVPAALCIVTQIFVSLGIDPMQHLLLSEAFSTSTKPWSIAWVTSIEYVLQILFIVLYFVGQIDRVRIIAIFFVTAGVMLALAIFLQLAIPETFGKSIKETRDLFRK